MSGRVPRGTRSIHTKRKRFFVNYGAPGLTVNHGPPGYKKQGGRVWQDREKRSHRNSNGQFDAGPHGPLPEDEKLSNPVGCKITGHELRRYAKIFDKHGKVFKWECCSDMYRDMLEEGCKVIERMITNLDPALVAMREQSDERERAIERGLRHTEFERTMSVVEEELERLNRNRDYGEIRATLKEFMDRTRRTKDPVIRARRMKEFERRGWDKMLTELSKNGMSLNPKDFTDDD